MTFEDFIGTVSDLAEELLLDAEEVSPSQLGLDSRAGYQLYAGEDFIAVDFRNDRSLQYYGGFEYIDSEHRTVVGGYVFYSDEASRVEKALDYYHSNNKD